MESGRPCSLNDTGGPLCCALPELLLVDTVGVPGLFLHQSILCLHCHVVFCLCGSGLHTPFSLLLLFLLNNTSLALEPIRSHCELIHLNLITLTKALSPNKIISSGKTSTCPFEEFQVNPQHKAIVNTLLKKIETHSLQGRWRSKQRRG